MYEIVYKAEYDEEASNDDDEDRDKDENDTFIYELLDDYYSGDLKILFLLYCR